MIQLIHQPIDPQQALAAIQTPQAGAVVLFLGTTREFTHDRRTIRLVYDAYVEMAERELRRLEQQSRERWPIVGCVLIHRLGQVDLGEASVLVGVSTPHRQDAFEAAAWLMDSIKRDVPIWKQENWADGQRAWVHPGAPDELTRSAGPSDRRIPQPRGNSIS